MHLFSYPQVYWSGAEEPAQIMAKTWWEFQTTCRHCVHHSIIHDFYALHLKRKYWPLELILVITADEGPRAVAMQILFSLRLFGSETKQRRKLHSPKRYTLPSAQSQIVPTLIQIQVLPFHPVSIASHGALGPLLFPNHIPIQTILFHAG